MKLITENYRESLFSRRNFRWALWKICGKTKNKSDEEAVNAWKNGQATAKDNWKANVTLKEAQFL